MGLSRHVSRSYDQDAASEDSEAGELDDAAGGVPASSERNEAPPGDRAALAIAVAKSYANLGALETSLRYYRLALNGKISDTARAEVTRSINEVRGAIRRNANNARRMPVIHKEIDQDHLVRPRLVAVQNASPPAKADGNPKEGGAQ
jgi:hypothetical protein